MATTSNQYFSESNGLRTYHTATLPNKETCRVVQKECIWEARKLRVACIGKGVLAAGISLALLTISYGVGAIAAVLIGAAAFPLVTIPPLYNSLVVIGGVGSALGFAYLTIRATGCNLLKEAKAHWAKADHYYTQAHLSALRQTSFA